MRAELMHPSVHKPQVTLAQRLLPGSTLGVLGGGQLGRMFVHCAQRMGYKTLVLDPDPKSPAGLVSHHHIVAEYLDPHALQTMLEQCDAVTTEFENVPADCLEFLAEHLWTTPTAKAVRIAQDRIEEKRHFSQCSAPVAPYTVIHTAADLALPSEELLPGILKTARLGYDGKGQIRVSTLEELVAAWQKLQLGKTAEQVMPCVLEKLLPLAFECSVVLARSGSGQIVHLPAQRNIHRNGILALSQVHEGCIPASISAQIIEFASSVAEELDYVGVLCVEFFVLKDSSKDGYELVVNEIAPRPHNSGHYSVEACDVSQFEMQVRCTAGLPLTQPRQHSPALMLNLLGDLWMQREPSAQNLIQTPICREPPWDALLGLPGVHLSLYGKDEPRVQRKMGHITITAAQVSTLYELLNTVTQKLGIDPFDVDY
jgi:5-(carboxyamino)imidazole ribonucleotide synthase